jgi:hypothetical protein
MMPRQNMLEGLQEIPSKPSLGQAIIPQISSPALGFLSPNWAMG